MLDCRSKRAIKVQEPLLRSTCYLCVTYGQHRNNRRGSSPSYRDPIKINDSIRRDINWMQSILIYLIKHINSNFHHTIIIINMSSIGCSNICSFYKNEWDICFTRCINLSFFNIYISLIYSPQVISIFISPYHRVIKNLIKSCILS